MTSPSYCIPAHANEIPAQKRGLTGAPYTTVLASLSLLISLKVDLMTGFAHQKKLCKLG